MARLTPREYAEKMVRKAQAASEDYVRGVRGVTESPMQKAKAKKAKLKANFQKAVDEGKWEEGLDRVSTEEWKEQTATKGGGRFGEGVAASMGKIESFAGDYLPFIYDLSDRVNRMPDNTPEERIAKAVAQMKGAAAFKRGSRRRV